MDERRSLPYSSSTAGRAITPSPHSSQLQNVIFPSSPRSHSHVSPKLLKQCQELDRTHGTLFPSTACFGKKTLKLVSNPPSFRD